MKLGVLRAASSVPLLLLLCAGGCSRTSIELQPAVIAPCKPGEASVIEVRWDARAAGADSVSIDVLRPGAAAKPWTSGGATGSRKTGRWGVDGLTFVLRDPSGRELGRRTVESVPCPTAGR